MTDAATSPKLRLGGMALRNGLLVHGPTHWAAAARRPDGTIGVLLTQVELGAQLWPLVEEFQTLGRARP